MMPHSTNDNRGIGRSMNSNSPFSSSSSNAQVASVGVGASRGTSSLDNKWRRASLPVTDMYSDINGNRARSGSIVSTASSARPYARRPLTHDLYHGTGYTKDKVLRDSPLIAELRTNVIIKDEYTLVTDLSYHLAARFSKPDTSIMINIDHSSCLALAGTFDPCYVLTLTTVPAALGAETNKRNASLIQAFMADILSVPPDRGIVRFNAVAEENYAINGNTVYGELERLDVPAFGATDGLRRGGVTEQRKSMINLKKSDLELQKPNGTATEREQRAARRKSTLNDTTSEVFELAADPEGKPSPTRSSNTAEAGPRMKASSRENIKGDVTRQARPKTVAAPLNGAISADTFGDERSQARPKHISTVIRAEQKSAHMPASAKSHARPISTVLNRQHSSGTKSLTSITPTPVTLKETIVENPKVLKADPKYDSDSAVKTSKRRSTISATPKMLAPPPVPESKAPKVSKRKSFLSAFRR